LDAGDAVAVGAAERDNAKAGVRADGEFDLRWFTPEVEDDLCGHATLASAYVLARRAYGVWPVGFYTRSGVLTVARDSDRLEMDFLSWPPQPCDVPAELLPAHGRVAVSCTARRRAQSDQKPLKRWVLKSV